MAFESDLVTADMVAANEFPELSYRYAVRGVPRTVVSGETYIDGALPEPHFIRAVLAGAPKAETEALPAVTKARDTSGIVALPSAAVATEETNDAETGEEHVDSASIVESPEAGTTEESRGLEAPISSESPTGDPDAARRAKTNSTAKPNANKPRKKSAGGRSARGPSSRRGRH